MEYEWLAIDFSYYAILTTILHANPNSAKGPFVRKECLLYARKAFVALKTIQDKISIDDQTPQTFPNVLTWYVRYSRVELSVLTAPGPCCFTLFVLFSFFFAML